MNLAFLLGGGGDGDGDVTMVDVTNYLTANNYTKGQTDALIAALVSAGSTATLADVVLGASGPSVSSSLNARGLGQAIYSTGVAGSTVTGVPAFRKAWTQAFRVREVSRNAGGQPYLSSGSGAFPGFLVRGSDGIVGYYTGSVANYSTYALPLNREVNIVATGDGTTTRIYANGVEVYSVADTTDYTGTLATIGSLYTVTGNVFIGSIAYTPFNYCMTSAQVRQLYESGLSPSDINNASNTSIVPAADSAFNNAIPGNWKIAGGTPSTSAGKLTCANGDSTYLDLEIIPFGRTFKPGQMVRLTVTIDSISAGNAQYYNGLAYVNFASAPGTYTVEYVTTGAANHIYLKAAGGTVVFDNFYAYALGALAAYSDSAEGNGLLWLDVSGNGSHLVLGTGTSWARPSTGANKIRGTTSTNGNQALLGGATVVAQGQILQYRARARAGAPTITLGISSGSAGLVGATVLGTNWTALTTAYAGGIVNSAQPIWVGSNSTDVVEIDITWEPLGF
jgi:hypothetical protein